MALDRPFHPLGTADGTTLSAAAAAAALGKELEVRRDADAVYFWAGEGRRRGRPRKNPVE